jgi:hypothetical protein
MIRLTQKRKTKVTISISIAISLFGVLGIIVGALIKLYQRLTTVEVMQRVIENRLVGLESIKLEAKLARIEQQLLSLTQLFKDQKS